MIRKYFDGGATEADGRTSAPVGPSVVMPWGTKWALRPSS